MNGLSEREDRFGTLVALADTDGDGMDDAIISVPGEEWGTTLAPTTLVVLFGDGTGLTSAGNRLFIP